jgi:hypothetical protein
MMVNLPFYFQLSVFILVRKQQSNMPLTAAEKMRKFQKDLGRNEEERQRERERGRTRSI